MKNSNKKLKKKDTLKYSHFLLPDYFVNLPEEKNTFCLFFILKEKKIDSQELRIFFYSDRKLFNKMQSLIQCEYENTK